MAKIEVVLGYFGLLLTVKVAIFFAVRTGGCQAAAATIVIAIAFGFNEHVDGFAQIAGADLLVLVDVGEFVDNNGEILAGVAISLTVAV